MKSPKAPMPHHITPMLAQASAAPFDNPGWFFEIKWDGYRAVAEVEQGTVRLYSRKQIPFDKKYAPICATLAQLGHDAVLDGEIVVLDPEGKARFHLLQNYQNSGRGTLIYYVFDLLYLDGRDLRGEELSLRREKLASLVKLLPNVRLSEHIAEHGVAFF